MFPRVSTGITVLACLFAVVGVILGELSIRCRLVEDGRVPADGVLCKCYGVTQIQRPGGTDGPAPHPDKAALKFRTRQGKTHARIWWIHRRSHLKDGFYLEVSEESGDSFSYNCDVDKSNVSTSEKRIRFRFNECCGNLESGSEWRPGMRPVVVIFARPLNTIDSKPYYVMASGEVPTSTDIITNSRKSSNGEGAEKCQRYNLSCHGHETTKEPSARQSTELAWEAEKSESPDDLSPLMIVLIAVCSLTGILVFGIILLVCIRFRKKNRPKQMDHRLLIVAENGDGFIPFVNCLVEIMKNHCLTGTKVTTNVRNSNEIANLGISQWTTRNIQAADVIVFIVTEIEQVFPKSLQSAESDKQNCPHVRVALNIAESVSLRTGHHASRKRFLVLDVYSLTNPSSVPFCTYYNLERKFSEFIKHALHLNYCSNAVDNDCVTLKNYLSHTSQRKVADHAFKRATEASNNLNCSILYLADEGQGKPLLTPNIPDDQLTSVENNTAQ